MKAHPVAKTATRNPQDATRRRDVAPLRRRIEKLEVRVRGDERLIASLAAEMLAHVRKTDENLKTLAVGLGMLELSEVQGKRRRSSSAARRN